MAAADPESLESLQKAVNDSAAKASLLWTSFLTLAAYLVVASGSVKHRDLFLGTTIKLPILGVELPITGFFSIAPLVLLIFHFYLVLQIRALSTKVYDFNRLLRSAVTESADRRLMRHRLDDFPILQLLAGISEHRAGRSSMLLVVVSWLTAAVIPLFVLLQMQIVFLPYHLSEVTWLQRIIIVADLMVIGFFWLSIRNPSVRKSRRAIFQLLFMGIPGVAVLVFSLCLATYPGEFVHRNVIATSLDYLTDSASGDSVPVSRLLFEGDIDDATGKPNSLFSNRIILPSERFYDEEKHKTAERSVSLRGRDLRGAVFQRTDLRKADFTGSNLIQASFVQAKLQEARFGCANRIVVEDGRLRQETGPCADLRGSDFSEASLQGANFDEAQLQGSRFHKATMQGASMERADLTAATFNYARLEGASFAGVTALGASFTAAHAQAADFSGADLTASSLFEAQLQGADFEDANFESARLIRTNFYRAFCDTTQFDNAIVDNVRADDRFPRLLRLARSKASRSAQNQDTSKKLDAVGYRRLSTRVLNGIAENTSQHVLERLQSLDPDQPAAEGQLVLEKPLSSDQQKNKEMTAISLEKITEIMCDATNAPFVASGLIKNGRLLARELDAGSVISRLRNPSNCPGAHGLGASDFRGIRLIEANLNRRQQSRATKAPDKADDDN